MRSIASETNNQSEMELLLCCARVTMTAPVAARIEAILTQPLDWERVLKLAEANKVLPLLFQHLNAVRPGAIPDAVSVELKDRARAIAQRNLARTGELVRVLGIFQAHDIAALPVKGPVLSADAYGDLGLRAYNDLDILIPESDVARARDLLIADGYRVNFMPAPSQESATLEIAREYKLYHAERDILIELQWRLVEKQFSVPFDQKRMWANLRPVCIAGATVMSLGPEDMLLFLCVHGAKHQWSRLGWICDLAEHIRSNPQMDWQGVLRQAESLYASRMLLLGLTLAGELLGSEIPGEILRAARKDATLASLWHEIDRRIRTGNAGERGPAAALWYYWRLRERLRDGLFFPIRLAAGVTVRDLGIINLPRPLSPLYLLMRPLRLVLKYGASIGKQRP